MLGRPGIHIDVGGEGRYPSAVNVNPRSTGIFSPYAPANGEGPIPNWVPGTSEDIPFPSGVAGRITLEAAPVRAGTPAEITRVLSPQGTASLTGPADQLPNFQSVADALGAPMSVQTVEQVGGKIATATIVRSGG